MNIMQEDLKGLQILISPRRLDWHWIQTKEDHVKVSHRSIIQKISFKKFHTKSIRQNSSYKKYHVSPHDTAATKADATNEKHFFLRMLVKNSKAPFCWSDTKRQKA